jgi:hypothetical protein
MAQSSRQYIPDSALTQRAIGWSPGWSGLSRTGRMTKEPIVHVRWRAPLPVKLLVNWRLRSRRLRAQARLSQSRTRGRRFPVGISITRDPQCHGCRGRSQFDVTKMLVDLASATRCRLPSWTPIALATVPGAMRYWPCAARSCWSDSVPRWRPFGNWSSRSQRHVAIIARMKIRHSRSSSRSRDG